MTTAELRKNYINVIKFHYGYELWDINPKLPYRKAIEPFIKDLVRISQCHKKGLSAELYKFDTIKTEEEVTSQNEAVDTYAAEQSVEFKKMLNRLHREAIKEINRRKRLHK